MSVLLGVEPDVRERLDRNLRRRLKRRCHRMLVAVGLEGVELSVLLAGDATVARLNSEYRGKRSTTDVLSFSQAAPDTVARWRDTPTLGDGPERVLGDLVISLDVVKKRSPKPAALEADLVALLAHGLLHLLGFEHGRAAERRHMLGLQGELVQTANAREPVRPLDYL